MSKSTVDSVLSKTPEPSLLQPDNHNKKYESLFNEIDTGQVKLPMFQREFVWDKEQSAKLIDSILKGYPISGRLTGPLTSSSLIPPPYHPLTRM